MADLCTAMLEGRLADFELEWLPGAVCSPVAVSAGYPGGYSRGKPVTIDEAAFKASGAKLFAAGLERRAEAGQSPAFYTTGGRVLAVAARGANPNEARQKAYQGLKAISFEGMGYREDIGLV
jgi:phosphoribosylamine--glycine ligase